MMMMMIIIIIIIIICTRTKYSDGDCIISLAPSYVAALDVVVRRQEQDCFGNVMCC